jgi:hypothetical protein
MTRLVKVSQSSEKCQVKSKSEGWARWLTPVILATREAKIRRMEVQSQPGAETPISKIPKK